MTNWAARPYKALMRDHVLDVDGSRTTALFLPGWDEVADTGCLCVERALERGVIAASTTIFAVERQRRYAAKIRRRLAELGLTKVHFWADELHKLDLGDYRIDYAFFDFLAALTADVAGWMDQHLVNHLAPQATLCFTMSSAWRNNPYMDNIAYAWKADPDLRLMAGRVSDEYGITNAAVLLQFVILKSIFARFAVPYRRAQIYRDRTYTMNAHIIEIDQTQPADDWPSISEVLARLEGDK